MSKFFRLFTPLFSMLLLAGCEANHSKSSDSAATVEHASGTFAEVSQDLVDLTIESPVDGMPGVSHPLVVTVTPNENVAQVMVHTYLSDEVDYEKSSPPAHVQGRHLTWSFERMAANEAKELEVWVRPRAEGHQKHCATVQALPIGCVSTFIGQPTLRLTKEGPERSTVGSRVHYRVAVENVGTLVARNVVVTDQVPKGLEGPGKLDSLEYVLGDIHPGELEQIEVELIALRRGRVCNLATAKSDNALQVSDEACTLIVEPRATLTKTGPSKSWVGKTAPYQLTVNNPGDTVLTNIVVSDRAPLGTSIVDAPGASISGDEARWNIASLDPNASRTFTISLKGHESGTRCNEATVTASDGIQEQATFCTEWQGHAALLIEVVDTEDPLLVGSTTTYRITVRNQGTAADHNVFIVAEFPTGLIPVDASGRSKGTIRNQMARFAAYPVLEQGEAIEFFIKVRASATGDHRVKVDLFSDLLKRPVTEEESTHVY